MAVEFAMVRILYCVALFLFQVPQYSQESLVLQARSLALNQLMTSRQLIVVATARKCFLLEKSYPVDVMEKVLRSYSPMSNQVRDFIEWLPPFQGCFLALHLACITTSGEVARMGTRILRVYGSEPAIENVRTVVSQVQQQQATQQSPSPHPVVTYSAKHDAFYYLFGRIVAPLWNVLPFVFGAEYKGAVAWISGIPVADIPAFLEQVQIRLDPFLLYISPASTSPSAQNNITQHTKHI